MHRVVRSMGALLGSAGARWRTAAATLVVLGVVGLAGCATQPAPTESPAPQVEPAAPPPPPAPPAQPLACPPCVDQSRELARLKQELATREAEVRELRAQQREQVKIVQESVRQVTRARVKLRRLATQADAASYLGEVEVALQTARSFPRARANAPLIAIAQSLLESATPPFDRGEYGVAIDRAVQAEELITVIAEHLRSPAGNRGREMPLLSPLALQLSADATLRRDPARRTRPVAMLKKGTPLMAYALRDDWLQVRTEDGRLGWIEQRLVALL